MDKCCFCGKDVNYVINGNDPRPIKIKDAQTPICCNECNEKIVIPTREHVWFSDACVKQAQIREILIGFVCDYNPDRFSNEDVYAKYAEILYDPIAKLETELENIRNDRDVWKNMAKCGDKLTEKMRDEYQQFKQKFEDKEKELRECLVTTINLVRDKQIMSLEKVKEFVKETSGVVGHEWRIDRFKVLEEIDKQIAELKERN